MGKGEDHSLITIKLFVLDNGVIKPHTTPLIELKYVPVKGGLYWGYPTDDVYEISEVMHHDLDVRILLTKISNSEKYKVMMNHN